MEHNLSTMYPGLNPIIVERESFIAIIGLYADVRRMQIRETINTPTPGEPRVIRRRAADDAGWW